MNHSEHILELLKKHTAQHPMRGDDLVKKLGIDPDEINDLLDDLQGRGALNRADIIKNGESWTALWPTGLTPRNTSWKEDRDNSKGFSRMAAHNAQAAAEASRTEIKPAPLPSPPAPLPLAGEGSQQEPIMPRVKAPALPKHTQPDHHPINLTTNTGAVQKGVLRALASGDWLDVASIYVGCAAATTLGSVGKTLETLAKRGVIQADIRFHDKRHRRFYRLADDDRAPTPAAKALADRKTAVMPKKPTAPIMSEVEIVAAVADMQPEPELVGRKSAAPSAECAAPTTTARLASITHGNPCEHASFAFYDDGALEIFQGDDTVMLSANQAGRLAAFVARVLL